MEENCRGRWPRSDRTFETSPTEWTMDSVEPHWWARLRPALLLEILQAAPPLLDHGMLHVFLGVYEDPTVRCMGAGVALMVDARASRQRHIFKPA